MGSEFTFYDYRGDDGVNVIFEWLNGLRKGAKAKFTNRLLHLEGTPPGQWQRPLVETLTDACADLFEIRVAVSHHQFRILGAHMGSSRTPTLLHGFTKPGDAVDPAECAEANARKANVLRDPAKYRVEHKYG